MEFALTFFLESIHQKRAFHSRKEGQKRRQNSQSPHKFEDLQRISFDTIGQG